MLLRRDEHRGYLADLLGVLVLVHVGLHAFLEDVFALNGEYPPGNGDAFIV